jgi:RNA polymerase sigma-70 factor (sigma-E family)
MFLVVGTPNLPRFARRDDSQSTFPPVSGVDVDVSRFLSTASRDDRRRAEFEQFVAGSTNSLLRTAYLLVGDLAESEDLVQECFVAVAKRWPRVRSMEHPRAYARRVLLNLALDGSARRSRRRLELERSDTIDERFDERSSGELTAVDSRSELVAALARLPPRQRAVLVLRYFEDLSESETAAALQCSIGTVKSTASRALARLQSAMTTPSKQES